MGRPFSHTRSFTSSSASILVLGWGSENLSAHSSKCWNQPHPYLRYQALGVRTTLTLSSGSRTVMFFCLLESFPHVSHLGPVSCHRSFHDPSPHSGIVFPLWVYLPKTLRFLPPVMREQGQNLQVLNGDRCNHKPSPTSPPPPHPHSFHLKPLLC